MSPAVIVGCFVLLVHDPQTPLKCSSLDDIIQLHLPCVTLKFGVLPGI